MTKIIKNVPVDISNEFEYSGGTYSISPMLKQYEVKNYPVSTNGNYNNWTNEAEMDNVIVIDDGVKIKFLDQDGNDITQFVTQI